MIKSDREKIDEIKNSFWGFLIEKRAVAWLVIAAITISGIFSLLTLPREIQPEINIPFVAVSVALPGANPEDVESLITKPIEEKVANVSDIVTLSSTSGFGFSTTVLEFDTKTDIDNALQKVKDAVDLAKSDLPDDALDPRVLKAEANAFTIISFSVMGNRPLHELTEIAENIEIELEKIPGVLTVSTTGTQKKIVEITLDQKKLEGYGLTIQTVADLIKFSNNNIPVGIVSSNSLNYSVRIDNRFQTLEEIRNLPLFTLPTDDKTTILLKDIADIEEAYPNISVTSRLSFDGEKSLPAITLQVFSKNNENILRVAQDSREIVEAFPLPEDIKVEVSNDNSVFIDRELGTLTRNGLQTTLIITFILFLALGLRKGIIAGLSMPLIFLIAFTVMDYMGMTINTLSLFSLVIALGLIVDTTIVIMEGIHENLRKGLSPKDSALLSIHTYKWPLIAGTMTTVFAFFPMLLVSGIMGEFLRTLPITISSALLGSLLVALLISPAIATKFIKKPKEGKRMSLLEPVFDKLGKKFQNYIHRLVKRKLARAVIIITALTAFSLSISLPITGILKTEMFTQTDQPYFVIDIESPKGVVVEETAKEVGKVEEYLYQMPEVESFLTKIGTSVSLGLTDDDTFFAGGGSSESNLANITVNMKDEKERERKSYEIAKDVREHFSSSPGAKIIVQEFSEGPPGDAAVTARITGLEIDELKIIANEVKEIIETIPGTTNARVNVTPGLSEFKFTLDKDALAFHGLSSMQVSANIRNIIQGISLSNVSIEGNDLDILIKYNLAEENNNQNISIHDIENFEIKTPSGYTVPLSDLGEYSLEQSLSSITREDEKRIVKVWSDLEVDVNAVETIKLIEEQTSKLDLPKDYEIKFGGDLEQINESFQDLFRSMIVGIILIAFTLVLMFNSFRQATIILMTLPLAMIGVFPGLKLIGLSLGFPAFLGIVALTGIVVNDAIVLIDRINKNRANGMEFQTSIAEAANARLQPIIMTSVTTICGILPLALTNEFWAGLGYALIFGLFFSTVLTLIVIPILYYALEGGKERKRLRTLA